jgi:group II intron reverse transcriptase/maturase
MQQDNNLISKQNKDNTAISNQDNKIITPIKENNDWDKIEHWDNINKVKWTGLPIKEIITPSFEKDFKKSKAIDILEIINNKSKKYYTTNNTKEEINPIKFSNLYNLISNIDVLTIAYAQVAKNKGSMTPGSKGNTVDNANMNFLTNISMELKERTFKWTPTKRVYIPKPGKKELRPLGIPDFKDKIVQASIRLVLESIYEPYFEYLNSNYGFRPKKGTTTAIESIKLNARSARYGLEADIKGAYDNVSHSKLISILEKHIKDKKLIKLIYDGLKAGILSNDTFYDTFMGTTQGSILSPLLFNIYMSPFDVFIKYKLPDILQEKLGNKFQINSPQIIYDSNPEYERIRSTKRRATAKTQKLKETSFENLRHADLIVIFSESIYCKSILKKIPILNNLHNTVTNSSSSTKLNRNEKSLKAKKFHDILNTILNEKAKEKIKSLLINKHNQNLKESTSTLRKTPFTTEESIRNIKFFYIRYADDWVLFTRSSKETVSMIKEICAEFLLKELSLTLSQEKTKITDIYNQKVQFLGFEIFFQKNPFLKKTSKGSTQRFTGKLCIYPDTERLENRFKLKGYLDKNNKPREVPFLTVITDQEIINKYNQFMIGIGTYYIPTITRLSTLKRWIYILYYSCIKTLAQKHKTSVKSIIDQYGYLDLSNPKINKVKPNAYDKRIVATYTFDGKTKHNVLLNSEELNYILLRIRYKYKRNLEIKQFTKLPNTIDFLTLNKVGLRTAFKLTSKWAICGADAPQSHHIKKLNHRSGHYQGYKGFDKVVAALGRKQLPVCPQCHENIHKGKYNNLSLNDLYDIRLIAPEGILLNINRYKEKDEEIKPKPKQTFESKIDKIMRGPLSSYKISFDNKTYFNQSFYDYLVYKNNTKTETDESSGSNISQSLSIFKAMEI